MVTSTYWWKLRIAGTLPKKRIPRCRLKNELVTASPLTDRICHKLEAEFYRQYQNLQHYLVKQVDKERLSSTYFWTLNQ